MKEELDTQQAMVHTLRNISAWQVWKLCGRTSDNIKKLPVSMEMRNNVLPLILVRTQVMSTSIAAWHRHPHRGHYTRLSLTLSVIVVVVVVVVAAPHFGEDSSHEHIYSRMAPSPSPGTLHSSFTHSFSHRCCCCCCCCCC